MSQFEEERNIQWLKHEYDKDGDNGPNNVNSVKTITIIMLDIKKQ